jgi:MATE family multidrug resistance protein
MSGGWATARFRRPARPFGYFGSMPGSTPRRGELRPMIELALPVVIGELGWMAMGVVDTVMVGRVGADAIGAVSVGRAVYYTIGVFGLGLLLGLDTLVSTAHGAGRRDRVHRALVHAVYLSAMVGVPMTALIYASSLLLDDFGIAPDVVAATAPYLRAIAWSAVPLLLYTTFRRYLQGVSVVRPVMLALVSANLINVAGNWLLIFGNLGAPKLGAEGAGWSTCISITYLVVCLLGAALLHDRGERGGLLRTSLALEPALLRRLVSLGLPAALQLVVEITAFALATALVGRLGAVPLAAHHLALTAASVTYMVPLGISSAAAVRVGQALGRGDPTGAGRAGWTALGLSSAFMAFAAVLFVVVPESIVRIVTDDPAVIAAGSALLLVAAFFQLCDGLQIVATGALRGTGDTRTAMTWNLIGHWLLGMPIGYSLCFIAGWGAIGFTRNTLSFLTRWILVGSAIVAGAACVGSSTASGPWSQWGSLHMKARAGALFSGNFELTLTEGESERRFETRAAAKFLGATIARSATVTTLSPDTGLPREYTQMSKKRGRRYRFGDDRYTMDKLKPGKDSGDSPDTWDVTSHKEFDYPEEADGTRLPLLDYYGMLLYLRKMKLRKPGDEVTLHIATSKGPQPFRIVVSEERARTLEYRDLDSDEKQSLDVKELRLRVIPADPESADEGFMNMEGETEIWVEAASKTPLEISGRVPKVPGRVRLVLTGMGS